MFTNCISFIYSSRSGEGVKIWWGNSNLSFGDKWNPFSTSVPYTILKSHILVTRKQSTNPMLMFNELPEILNQAVKEFHSRVSTGGASPDIPLVEEDISFDYYLGLTALVHNQSFLGFFKKRGAVNWWSYPRHTPSISSPDHLILHITDRASNLQFYQLFVYNKI